ncbi:MAG: type IV pilus twitching motility protein PilT [Gemmatimonadales bacterium]|nr:type IV pilus twitching motility protein PilT [Gemmatimonadota bacterium]MCC7132419.1 type IV pilus twitching motility protein PilT [Gemmatimonadales bacterium]MDX2056211.1 type IV pilus twitching motility protein PilT [Gemmatimonadales bacterium]
MSESEIRLNDGPSGGAVDGRRLNLRALLQEMIDKEASDLHITAGERPKLRIDGDITDSSVDHIMSPKDTLQLAYSVLTEAQKKRFELEDELDFSFGIQNLARFRGNVFKQRGCVAMVLRMIPFSVRTFDELGLPPVMARLSERPRGLILVTGPTGSGKSTTLAAVIDKINKERKSHIITVEDPIEFIHRHQGCIVNQREIGTDTKSFAAALKYALREDPDVILVGEMRDLETIAAALTIAETGHLVLATLHTNSAAESINRIIDVFPSNQQSQIRAQLAFVLEGVVTQTLLQKNRGKGRVMACEIMVATPAIRALIRDDKIHQIYSALQSGKKHGMQTMTDSLYQLYMNREVPRDECLRVASDPNEFLRMIGEKPLDDQPIAELPKDRPDRALARR